MPEHRGGVRQWTDASLVALERFDEGFGYAVCLQLCTWVKHGTKLRSAAKSSVSLAVKGLPLSDSHSTACGAWTVPKRSSTASNIRSRTIEPLMPVPAAACQASVSQS
jgi:hypothetical protein